MRIVLVGPPGAGKGTQATRLTRRLLVPHISTGAAFREIISSGTPLGRLVDSYISRGQLVPDGLAVEVASHRLAQPDVADGFLLDGFPRNVSQARAFDALLDQAASCLDAVLSLEVSESTLIERIAHRLTCGADGSHIFNAVHRPPKYSGTCDECSGELVRRDDDEPRIVDARLRGHRHEIGPLLDHYRQRNLLCRIPAEGDVDKVTRLALAALPARQPSRSRASRSSATSDGAPPRSR